MKKAICAIMVIIALFAFTGINSNANSETPEYNASFDNGKGIFYANGITIRIKENEEGNTIVYWNGGEQVVPTTVRIIGGGKEGKNFSETNIIMESGTVSHIYGGGASLDENNIAIVGKSNIIINGGNILQTIYGGGLLFSTTTDANIMINGGSVKSVCGGGSAAATISGVTYAAGIESDLENSKNKTVLSNIIIDGGKIDTEPSTQGSVFGGGQGYSYVATASIKVNSGDLTNAYLIAGGSNGYTKNSNVTISGGSINVFQTVNRGKMDKSIVRIDGGTIKTVYIGGEDDLSVTGIINNVDFAVLNGNVENLLSGISGGNPIIIEQENYKAVVVDETVVNSQVEEKQIKIKYDFKIIEEAIKLEQNENIELETQISTVPTGYEYLFKNNMILWRSLDNTIVETDDNGNIIGKNLGKTIVTGNFLQLEDSIQIQVITSAVDIFYIFVLFLIFLTLVGYFFI